MKPTDLNLPAKFVEFRRYPGFDQLATADDLAAAAQRFPILNAATGSGKSVTYAAAAALSGARWLVLVGTKDLQAQLLGDGLVERLVYGHRNYPCTRTALIGSGTGLDSDADDPEFQCSMPGTCGYSSDVDAANKAQSVVANYAYWLSIGRYSNPGMLGEFDLLVLDEADSAPDWLTKAVAVTITRNRLRKVLSLDGWPVIPQHTLISSYREWAIETLKRAFDRLSRLDRTDKTERRKVDRLIGDLEMVAKVADPDSFAEAGYREPWIVKPVDSNYGDTGICFSPRWGSDFAEQLLFRGIKKVILTSATVTRKHASYLGIPESEYQYREVPSPFDVRRRPVIWIPTVRVDYRLGDGGRWKLQRRIDDVIEAAIAQDAGNGVIHTGSYERNAEIVANSRYRPVIISHRQDSNDFNQAFARFKQQSVVGKFSVFASPRVDRGVDLANELTRWQLILKAGTVDSRDPLTKARLQDNGYREMLIAEVMQQMIGRPVRNEMDFATTVVIDDHWAYLRFDCPFAEWFREAFVTIKEVSELKFLTHDIVSRFGPVRRVELIR